MYKTVTVLKLSFLILDMVENFIRISSRQMKNTQKEEKLVYLINCLI